MDEEARGQIPKEEQERADIQSRAEKFVKDHAGYYDQEELERWTSKYQSLSSDEQQRERNSIMGRLEKSVDEGKYGEMGLEFAMLAQAGIDFDIPTRLSYVNRVLVRDIFRFDQHNSERRRQEPYSESIHGNMLNRLGELQVGLGLANKLHVLTSK
ncbi:MAG: hypothetical protein M1575_03500 [Patescibacteria group bacterium]|nr:hypothetical protein [Patescibacteria group bacterium]MCL5095764.1 hypothetical protein [Patescibacteria group bacterium]